MPLLFHILGCIEPYVPPTAEPPPEPTGIHPCDRAFGCVVGTGATRFERVDGGPLTLVHGPQGGWHVVTGVRVYTTEPVLRLRPELYLVETGEQLAGAGPGDTFNQALQLDEATCTGEALNLFAILDDGPTATTLDTICALDGRLLELTVHAETPSGATTACTTTGVATLDPMDEEACAR